MRSPPWPFPAARKNSLRGMRQGIRNVDLFEEPIGMAEPGGGPTSPLVTGGMIPHDSARASAKKPVAPRKGIDAPQASPSPDRARCSLGARTQSGMPAETAGEQRIMARDGKPRTPVAPSHRDGDATPSVGRDRTARRCDADRRDRSKRARLRPLRGSCVAGRRKAHATTGLRPAP